MKAVYIKGKEDLEIADVPVPEPGPGQVRIAVEYVGICGSDLHYYFNGANGTFVIREPLIPGHEMSGHIDLDPQGEWAPGTPITLHPATFGPDQPGMENLRHLRPGGSYLGSASTWPHTQGAMAEYMLVNRDMIRLLPESVSTRTAALVEPLAAGGGEFGQTVRKLRCCQTDGERSFSQNSICLLLPAMGIMNTIPDSVVLLHGAVELSRSVPRIARVEGEQVVAARHRLALPIGL